VSIELYHHPFSRAANVVWMLEEVGVPYALHFVDLRAGAQKSDAHRALNKMGKIPVLVDGDVVVSETAAIALYLADRYAPGRLAPAVDEADRGPYLRWTLFAPSVIEPCCMAKAAGWTYRPGTAGFGSYEELCDTLEDGLRAGPWLLGERFSMADVVVGGSLRWMLQFSMIEARPAFTAYAERLTARPALQASLQRNAAVAEERGLTR
jgi:glutathione S-transferase